MRPMQSHPEIAITYNMKPHWNQLMKLAVTFTQAAAIFEPFFGPCTPNI
jgi:hypothetical protein